MAANDKMATNKNVIKSRTLTSPKGAVCGSMETYRPMMVMDFLSEEMKRELASDQKYEEMNYSRERRDSDSFASVGGMDFEKEIDISPNYADIEDSPSMVDIAQSSHQQAKKVLRKSGVPEVEIMDFYEGVQA